MKVAMWGPKSSGKTTYIAMVYGISLLSTSKWTVRPKNIASTNFVREKINQIRRGEFPAPTDKSPEPIYYQYEIRANSAESREEEKDFIETLIDFLRGIDLNTQNVAKPGAEKVIVDFADVAGEQYIEEPLDHPLWDHLAHSDGLICMLDPTDANDHFDITFQLMQFLAMKVETHPKGLVNGRLPHHVAFCFSKIDSPEFYGYVNQPIELMKVLEDKTGINIDKLISPFILPQHLKYFTVSAVGSEARVEGSHIQNPRKIKPINLLEPLSWLFQSAGV